MISGKYLLNRECGDHSVEPCISFGVLGGAADYDGDNAAVDVDEVSGEILRCVVGNNGFCAESIYANGVIGGELNVGKVDIAVCESRENSFCLTAVDVADFDVVYRIGIFCKRSK